MWVEGDLLNFRLLYPGLPPPELELAWGRSLIDFSPRETSIGQVIGINVRVWVETLKTQLAVEVELGREPDPRACPPGGLRRALRQGGSDAHDPGRPGRQPDRGDSPWRSASCGGGSTPGSRPAAPHSATHASAPASDLASGRRQRFSGATYRLTSVAHTIGSGGYRTSFEARREVI